MDTTRRSILAMAGLAPLYSFAGTSAGGRKLNRRGERLVLSDFTRDEPFLLAGTGWRGFTDRVMGGVSDAEFNRDEVDGRRCVRMTGDVTREYGGGFVQMALYFDGASDASGYDGLELLVHGNDEDYNVHVRTADCGWHDESYRATFHANAEWQTVRLPWEAFRPNGVSVPLDASRLRRIGLLGWMREFEADLSLGQIALWREGASHLS